MKMHWASHKADFKLNGQAGGKFSYENGGSIESAVFLMFIQTLL
jgi:hypothetical protein